MPCSKFKRLEFADEVKYTMLRLMQASFIFNFMLQEILDTRIFIHFFFLAPGGFIVESTDPEKPSRSDICVFRWDGNELRQFYDVSPFLMNIDYIGMIFG